MKRKPLSDRQELLLGVVAESVHGFYPHDRCYYAYDQIEVGHIYGAADAAAMRGLESRGLIKSRPSLHPYAFTITEDGQIEYEKIAATRGWPP